MLNKSIIDRGTKLAEGALCYGVHLQEMTREELIAIAAIGWKAYTEKLDEPMRKPLIGGMASEW